uniref:Uncharacterized protein n=1 Tax=Heterorhabditis bacteriophora TaxID=37862 RepID=A0A1I7WFN7_HETBA
MMCFCFESQFDSCILDRPIIINAIRILTTQLPDEPTLTFDFFIQVTLSLIRLPRWRRRGRLSEAALSCRVKILRVITMVKVVNRWRQMAADMTVGAASLVSLIAAATPQRMSHAEARTMPVRT